MASVDDQSSHADIKIDIASSTPGRHPHSHHPLPLAYDAHFTAHHSVPKHYHPNPKMICVERFRLEQSTLGKLRQQYHALAAEFLGTLILVLFGTSANCQTVLLSNGDHAKGDWLSGIVGWGFGIALGVWVSSGISGGHINPAVTLVQAIFRRFPWKKVPGYWLAQLLGAFVGSLLTYCIYNGALNQFEGHDVRTMITAGLFGTYPLDYVTSAAAFFTEFLATALLIITVFSVTDKYNNPPPPGIVPFVIFIMMTGLAAVFGAQTSFAMNPARDLGPRMMSAMFYGRNVFNFRHQYWLWGPICADFAGAIIGAVVYDVLIYTGHESPVVFYKTVIHPEAALAVQKNISEGSEDTQVVASAQEITASQVAQMV